MDTAQDRFKRLLGATTPRLKDYWDWERGACHVEALCDDMGTWSHGERIMAQFALAVWQGRNDLGFDLIEAARTLNEQDRAVIEEWLAEPFWP